MMKIIITSFIIAVLLGSSEAGQNKAKSRPSNVKIKITHLKDKGFKLTCKATGEELSYHWYAQKGHLLSNEVAKGNVLSITRATSKNYRVFCCRASNTAGSRNYCTGLPVTYTYSVLKPFRIGSSVHLKCVVDPIDPRRYVITWKRENNLPLPEKAIIDGGHLKIGKLTETDAGIYICIGSRNGVYEVFRHRATLNVVSPRKNINQKVPLAVKPGNSDSSKARESNTDKNITAHPKSSSDGLLSLSELEGQLSLKKSFRIYPENQTIEAGESSTIDCELVSKDPTIYFEWQRERELPVPSNFHANGGHLDIHWATKENSGEYICIALNSDGKVLFNSSSTLKVIAPPRVHLNEPDEFFIGHDITLYCESGGELLTYNWTVQGRSLLSNENAHEDTLLIYGFTKENEGTFCCNGYNVDGSDRSCQRVAAKIMELMELRESSMEVAVNGTVTPWCYKDRWGPKMNLHWERSGDLHSSNLTFDEYGYLTLSQVTKKDGGDYFCVVSNTAGMELARKKFTLNVISAPETIEITPIDIDNGGLSMNCEATGDKLTYAWTAKEGLLSNEKQWLHELDITKFGKANDRTFCCTAFNMAGQVEKCTRLSSEILISTSDEDISVGDSFEMNCQVFGSDASKIHLQWQRSKDDELSKNATIKDGVLKIHNVVSTDAGSYNCIGLNDDGKEVLRKNYYLEVRSPPTVMFETDETDFKIGGSVSIFCVPTGDEPMTIEWETKDKVLLPNEEIEGSILTVGDIPKNFDRTYKCTAANELGTASKEIRIHLQEEIPHGKIIYTKITFKYM